jgi:uncharacterized protein
MKPLIITGAGTGLGAALAEKYAKLGHHVILVGRTLSKLNETKQIIEQQNGRASIYLCDIKNAEEVMKMVTELQNEYDSIDGVINNAGIGYFEKLENLTYMQINDMIDTNIKGTILLTAQLLPLFKKQNSGKIMNIISTAGLRGKVNESVYVASKFAVRGFTESLMKELEQTNIQVTAVYMGGMSTPFWTDTDHIKDKSRLKNPLDVAQQIVEYDDGRSEIFIDR